MSISQKRKTSEIIIKKEGTAIFTSTIKEELTKKNRLYGDEVITYVGILGNTHLGRKHNQCKELEVGADLMCSRKDKKVLVV